MSILEIKISLKILGLAVLRTQEPTLRDQTWRNGKLKDLQILILHSLQRKLPLNNIDLTINFFHEKVVTAPTFYSRKHEQYPKTVSNEKCEPRLHIASLITKSVFFHLTSHEALEKAIGTSQTIAIAKSFVYWRTKGKKVKLKIIIWGSVKSCFPFSDETSTAVATSKFYKLPQKAEKFQKFQLSFGINCQERKLKQKTQISEESPWFINEQNMR